MIYNHYNPSFYLLLFVILFLTNNYITQAGTRHLFEVTLSELPKPELPHIPEIPTLPNPEFPEIQKPKLPTLPKPEVPHLHEIPTLPKPEFPEIPKP
ncbi:hypothetical protein MTR67_016313 [Solanum verrucosum]|uniref:Gamma-gliadin n=1 Tax=Solanum verrucosum TaxID=315347 RepID=A0AAF0TQL5_SOLVR|nr:hypothetical protein MTR67_016313 [Solanum verrucosum]